MMSVHKMMNVLLIFVLMFGCCTVNEKSYDTVGSSKENKEIKHIEVSGIKQAVTISEKKPVKISVSGIENNIYVMSTPEVLYLSVSGNENVIKIENGIAIKEIHLSGIENVVYLPEKTSPEIINTGINCRIIRY